MEPMLLCFLEETSVGKYPVQVIKQMSNILKSVEGSSLIQVPQTHPHIRTNRYITKTICYHAANMANEIDAKAISTLTNSGYTAFQISAWRPSAHILVFTSNKRILTQLNLLWGVRAFYYDKYVSTDETIEDVNNIACKMGYLDVGDMLISLAAMPIVSKGMVNTLRVTEITSCPI
jgi:pyruvate kinase